MHAPSVAGPRLVVSPKVEIEVLERVGVHLEEALNAREGERGAVKVDEGETGELGEFLQDGPRVHVGREDERLHFSQVRERLRFDERPRWVGRDEVVLVERKLAFDE